MEEMEYYQYLPGGSGHRKWEVLLSEFRRGLAEALGTFTIVLVVCMGNASPHASQSRAFCLSHSMPCLEQSLTCAQSTNSGMHSRGLHADSARVLHGQVSGSHFNPATSIAFSLRLAFKWWRLLYYIPAQFVGAMLASLTVMGFLGTEGDVGASLPSGLTVRAALGMEILFTTILLFVTLNVAERAKVVGANAAIAVGVVLIALTVIGGPLGGASMNPFRSLAPALLAGGRALDVVWVYVVGPLVGAVIAVLLTCAFGTRVHPYASHKATGVGRSGPEDLSNGQSDGAAR